MDNVSRETSVVKSMILYEKEPNEDNVSRETSRMKSQYYSKKRRGGHIVSPETGTNDDMTVLRETVRFADIIVSCKSGIMPARLFHIKPGTLDIIVSHKTGTLDIIVSRETGRWRTI